MTLRHLLPARLLLLLAFVLAGVLPQARAGAVTTPAALSVQDQGQGVLGAQRVVLQALVPDDNAADPDLPRNFALMPQPHSVQRRANVPHMTPAPLILTSIPPARGPPAV